jgi:hypothetical protein
MLERHQGPSVSRNRPIPFVSSAVETPIVRSRLHGLSTSLEANGEGDLGSALVLSTSLKANGDGALMPHAADPYLSCNRPIPFVSSAVETPIVRLRLHGLSTSLEVDGGWSGHPSSSAEKGLSQ